MHDRTLIFYGGRILTSAGGPLEKLTWTLTSLNDLLLVVAVNELTSQCVRGMPQWHLETSRRRFIQSLDRKKKTQTLSFLT